MCKDPEALRPKARVPSECEGSGFKAEQGCQSEMGTQGGP